MAIVTNAFATFNAKGNREDLTDIIENVSPTATPFMSGAGRTTCRAVLHEWQMDALAAAADNKVLQGDETSAAATTATVRVGNYTQISKKSVAITGTQEAVDKAGRNSELAYQLAKLGKELKRDMEVALLSNKGGVGASSGVIPELAGLGAWVKTNDVFLTTGTPGASPTWTSGVPSAGRTDCSNTTAFTEVMLKDAMRLTFASGGEPSVLMVGPKNKQVVSGFAGIAPPRYMQSDSSTAAIIGAADVYRSDYGLLTVVPNRFQRERDAWLIDFDQVAVGYLRPFFQEELAKIGDAERRHMLVEYTLVVKNEAGLGGIFDLAG